MRSVETIRKQIQKIHGISIINSYYRYLGVEYLNNPLSALYSKLAGGRYNFKGKFEALYLAPDPHTALDEGSKEDFNFKSPPKAVILIDVEVNHIIDLEDEGILKKLNIDNHKLIKPWRRIQRKGKESYTQTLGRLIYESNRFEGIRYPSAKVVGKYNLVIYPDRLKDKKDVKVYDPRKILDFISIRRP